MSNGTLGVILAGGRNTRFPYPKGLIRIDGLTIIERQAAMLAKLTGRVIISTNMPELYFRYGLPMIGDTVPSRGPISGIFSALRWSGAGRVLALSSDMPYIGENLLEYLLKHAALDATVCMRGGWVEPMPGIYAASALRAIGQGVLGEGSGSMLRLLGSIETRYISDAEVRALDPEGKSFVNINTPEDLEANLNPTADRA